MPDVQLEIGLDIIATLTFASVVAWKVYTMWLKPSYDNQKKFKEAMPHIEQIVAQLSPNGGASLRDAIDRIERRMILVEEKQNVYLMDVRHGIFETNHSGKITGVNRTFCRMLNCTENELTGYGWLNFVENQKDIFERFNHCVSNEIEFKMTFDMKKTTGELVHVTCSANPLRSSIDKSLIGYLGVIEETIE
jgi:PAS domain S-box-containing protein